MCALLRYAGSKHQLADQIAHHIGKPALYVEPFLGAAHVALALPLGTPMLLADALWAVANFWIQVKEQPRELFADICEIKEWPYTVLRSLGNDVPIAKLGSLRTAAIACVLQARCFNGVMRVNSQGEYNVPEGRNKPCFPSLSQLLDASAKLQSATILCQDWETTLETVPAGATVYADPPYWGQHSAYTKEGFDANEHRALAVELQQRRALGTRVLVSNADKPECDVLYTGLTKHLMYPVRSVGGKRGSKAEALWIS